MDILKTLQALNDCHGPAGDEHFVAAAIRELATPYADEITTDVLGNLTIHKKGNGPKVLFAAHMDSIGFVVTHIDEKGFIRFGKLGGLHANSILHAPVRFKNGVRGLVSLDCAVEEKDMKLDDLYIDIGAENEAEAKTMVTMGDTAIYDSQAFSAGAHRLVSSYMDNRISCVVLLMALEMLKASDNDLYFVFTVQEEVGLRGSKVAAYSVAPDYGIAVDVTCSDDEMNTKHSGSAKAGHGAAIKVMDASVICHPAMVEKLKALAEEKNIPAQMDVLRAGGTDAGSIHIAHAGVYTGGISIPCRYVHSPVEMVDRRDVEACAKLVVAFAESKLS